MSCESEIGSKGCLRVLSACSGTASVAPPLYFFFLFCKGNWSSGCARHGPVVARAPEREQTRLSCVTCKESSPVLDRSLSFSAEARRNALSSLGSGSDSVVATFFSGAAERAGACRFARWAVNIEGDRESSSSASLSFCIFVSFHRHVERRGRAKYSLHIFFFFFPLEVTIRRWERKKAWIDDSEHYLM